MKILIYDCEVAADPDVVGWRNFKELGASVIGCHANWLADPYIHFDRRDENYLDEFLALAALADELVGFNSKKFDDQLLAAHGAIAVTTIDLLEEIRELSGQPRQYVEGVTREGYTLDAIARANNLPAKIGNGAQAGRLWAAGEYQQVIDYCLHDVGITVGVFDAWRNGSLIDPTTGANLQ